MKNLQLSVIITVIFTSLLFSQTKTTANKNLPYHPEDNAAEKINTLINQAQTSHKNIILQVGGNWCSWCLLFTKFAENNNTVSQIIKEHYLYYHLNYSSENKNVEVLDRYGNPGQEFGYPVFVILNEKGEMIHVQDSAVLEEGKGYNETKVVDFLLAWLPQS